MTKSADARRRLLPIGCRVTALVAAILVLGAVTLSAGHTSVASAQATYTIPIQYANFGLGYGGYGLGYGGLYGGYGLGYGGYGLGYGGYGFGYGLGGYGLGYGGYYGLGYGLGYGAQTYVSGYGSGYGGYYGSSVPVYQTATTVTPASPSAVTTAWTFCTGANGPVYIRPGQSTLGLIC
jgi:hypothetical protein